VFKGASPAKQEAAFKFIKFMTQPDIAADWSVKTGYVATSAAAYATPTLKNYTDGFPQAIVARDQLQHAVPELTVHENQRVTKFLNDAIQAILTGARPAEAAMKQAQTEAMRVLAQYK
jgi:sn-glycerol 3-phosphate transport system substrate-binding protein